MTCIVGLVGGEKVYLGADAMVTRAGGWGKTTMPETKLWKSKELLFGGCGNVRPLQVLRHHLRIPPREENQTSQQYLIKILMPAIRETLYDQDMWNVKKGLFDGSFMLGYRGALFEVDGDLSVSELADQYGAKGSGEEYALGSLFSTKDLKNPRTRIKRALEAASYHQLHVGPPFSIQSV